VTFFLCALAQAADAQTWQWQFTVKPPGLAPVPARSSVDLSGARVTLLYTAHIRDADVPIASCSANVRDVAGARKAIHDGRAFLLIDLKPQRTADCDGGARALATMPVVDDAALADALAAIDRACCGAAVAAAPAAPASPAAPRPSAPPAAPLADWVENDGLFSFVRVRNRSDRPASILGGAVQNCRGVASGCGGIAPQTVPAGATVTLAAVMANPHEAGATFSYRYDVAGAGGRTTAGGVSTKAPAGWHPAMTPEEIRTAEALAVAGWSPGTPAPATSVSHAPAAHPSPPAFTDARLLRRGSSRLAIGIKGTSLVRVHLDASGKPQSVDVVKVSDPRLAPAAIETAVSSAYAPAERNGRPVDGTYVAEFDFDGDDPALSGIPVWKRDPTPAPSPT
jgi:hypothetical protein